MSGRLGRRSSASAALIAAAVSFAVWIVLSGLNFGRGSSPTVSPGINSPPIPTDAVPATPSNTIEPAVVPSFAEFGWFQLEAKFQNQSTLIGFDFRAGTFDGVVTSSIQKSFPPLTPAIKLRGALPFARGPVEGVVLYGFTDAAHSELHSVSIATGEDRLLIQTTDVIHDASWDAETGMATYIVLRRSDRQPAGIFQVGLSGAEPESRSLGWGLAPNDRGSVSHRLMVTQAGGIAVISCALSICEVRAATDAFEPIRLVASQVPDRDVFGVAGDELIMGSACTPACPATAIDLTTGAVSPSASYCETAVLLVDEANAILVSDVAPTGECPSGGYVIRATDLNDGRTWRPYESRDSAAALVPQPGWELPSGWLLLARDGQIAFERDSQLTAVRVGDGQRVSLPVTP